MSRATISSPVAESRLPVGSSASSTRGPLASARAIATRCCSPPESCEGRCEARGREPDAVEQRARAAVALGGREARGASAASTFCAAVSVGIRLNCWKTNPSVSRRSAASSPSPIRARSWPSNSTRAARRAVERAEQLQQRRLARARRAGDDDELAGADLEVDAVDGRDLRRSCGGRRAGSRAGSCRAPQSMWRRASAGRRRAARRPPTAPATSPPSSARPIGERDQAEVDGRVERDFSVPRGDRRLAEAEDGAAARARAAARRRRSGAATVASSVGPSAPTSAAPPTPSSAPSTPPSAPWAATRR